jgi:cell division septation protein DedD
MNKNILRGLAVVAALLILLVVLYRLYTGSAPPTGPSPVTAPTPTPTAPPAVTPPAAAPAPKEAGPHGPVAAPPVEPVGPAKEVAPGAEVRPPGPQPGVSPPSEQKEQYGLLVGRYRKYRDAGKMLARLKKHGIPGFIRRDPGKPHRYQVLAGPFPSRAEALAAEKSLRALLKRTPKIEPLPAVIPK